MRVAALCEAKKKGRSLEGYASRTGKIINGQELWEGVLDVEKFSLTSLKGSPHHVTGYFSCSLNQLSSLAHGPVKVDKSYYCNNNVLTTLEGVAKIGGGFYCSHNLLTSLEGLSEIGQYNFYCYHNQLRSLKYGPTVVSGNLDCSNNKIDTIEGFPSKVERELNGSHNAIESLAGIHSIIKEARDLIFDGNPIKSHVLGVLLIKGCVKFHIDNRDVMSIINRYLHEPAANRLRDMVKCQSELLDAGLDEYAQL